MEGWGEEGHEWTVPVRPNLSIISVSEHPMICVRMFTAMDVYLQHRYKLGFGFTPPALQTYEQYKTESSVSHQVKCCRLVLK